jgi:aspartate aminotransferase
MKKTNYPVLLYKEITMSTAKKIQAALRKSSWIRKMFEEGTKRKAIYGEENVFDFSLGNPNIDPPVEFETVLRGLLNDTSEGRHCYMPNAGYEDTRQAVADYLTAHNNQTFGPDDIVMTVGAAGALNVILKTILNPGDEVIIPGPFFMEYIFYVDNHQGIPKLVDSNDDFSLNMEKIRKAITNKTKAVLINSPNNPTGKVFSREELTELGKLLDEFGEKRGNPIYLVSDEPYRKIAYDVEVPSIFDTYRESFIATSFSKDLSLPGERIGYAALNPEMSDRKIVSAGLVFCNRILGFVNAPAMQQRAVSRLLNASVDVSIYRKKRDLLCDGLSSLDYEFILPQGAFYLFPKSPIEDDIRFVSILQEENILTVPGSGCGRAGHFRIAYCVSDSTITNSMPGFERAIRNCG